MPNIPQDFNKWLGIALGTTLAVLIIWALGRAPAIEAFQFKIIYILNGILLIILGVVFVNSYRNPELRISRFILKELKSIPGIRSESEKMTFFFAILCWSCGAIALLEGLVRIA